MVVCAIVKGYCFGFPSKGMENFIEDLKLLKPTIIGSFPVFYNKLYKKIH